MGVYEERALQTPGMHWQQQQHERYVGPAYDPSRDLSPNLPACDAASSMGDVCDPGSMCSSNSDSACSTPNNNNNTTSNNNNHQHHNHHHHHNNHLHLHPSCAHHTTTPPSSTSSSNGSSASSCNLHHHHHNNNNNNNNNSSSNNNNSQHHPPNSSLSCPHSSCVQQCLNNASAAVAQPALCHNQTCHSLANEGLCRLQHQHQQDHQAHHLLHQVPKLEPPGTPPPTPSGQPHTAGNLIDHQEVVICAGCGHRICDRFYLQAVDRRWHAACLQCCQCRHTLDGEITCFSRDGNIYCKKDYYRIFGMKRCSRCQAAILASELVMRARDLVFHVHCFTCAVCNSPLTKGDHFGMRDAAVLCRLHYEMSHHHSHHHLHATPHHPLQDGSPSPAAGSGGGVPALGGCFAGGGGGGPPASQPQAPHYPPPFPSPDFHPQGHQVSPSPMSVAPPSVVAGAGSGGLDCSTGKVPYFNGGPAAGTPRQKGRPRKRKPKDLESMTANLDLNSDYLDMPFGRSPGTPGMHGSSQRTKRMRTSFKHHQLRTMKSYFAINHNPDAKDLKQLSQKTGLPKRVLQVWFQNARAKWRRMMLKQEGKGGDKCSGSESGLGDLDVYPHGPGSLTGSIQSLPPHSPPFMLGPGPGSPNSLDCA